jgi:amidohydrolase
LTRAAARSILELRGSTAQKKNSERQEETNVLKEKCRQVEQQMIAWRRDFHQHPELSFQERRTAEIVARVLRNLGCHVRENVNGYGVIGDLTGAHPGPVIALRADMDALPIAEETGLPYASKHPGVMHACAHDGHMSALLGAAAVLSAVRQEIRGTVRFIFQPAEETLPGGAKGMIEQGALEQVSAIYGMHLWSELPLGTFRTTLGPMMAAVDNFTIDIFGKGGHGGMPHRTVDALLAASHVVMASQHIVSRQMDPVESGVITFGKIEAGTTHNVVADKASLIGTMRSFSPEVRELLQRRITETARQVAALYGAEAAVNIEEGYPAVVNHAREAEIALEEARHVFSPGQAGLMAPNMASEDFAYYLQHVPGAFCFIGAGDPERTVYPHHHPRFHIHESSLALAAEWFCRIALRYVGPRHG